MPLAVNRLLPGLAGIFHEGNNAFTRKGMAGRVCQAGQFAEGGVNIDELDQGISFYIGLIAGCGNNQGDLQGVVKCVVFAPVIMLAEVPAVICPQDDDRVVGLTVLLQLLIVIFTLSFS